MCGITPKEEAGVRPPKFLSFIFYGMVMTVEQNVYSLSVSMVNVKLQPNGKEKFV